MIKPLPLTLIEPGLYGLGCACNQVSGLGDALTRAKVEAFFIGPNKYVRNENKATNIYDAPGGAPVATVPAGGNMGRVVYINEGLNWGKLDSGKWIYLENSLSTTILSVPPPTSFTDALSREAVKAAEFGWDKLKPVVITIGMILIGLQLANTYVATKAKNVSVA